MQRNFICDYDDYDMDDYFYSMYRNRLITTEEIDQELDEIFEKDDGFLGFKKMKRDLNEKLNKLSTKIVLYVVRDIMLKEMGKPYYDNLGNVSKIIDIDSHMVFNADGSCYQHVEKLCIWQNGFYEFNSSNMTTPMMRYTKSNNFNEEIVHDLEELDCHGRLVSIDSKDQGTQEDYARLEAKILKMSKQHESYTE